MALRRCKREITEEQYNRFKENGINRSEVFSDAELCGYGVYGTDLWYDPEQMKHYVTFEMGSTCD